MKTIDCNAMPFLPEGWKLLRHKKDGVREWDVDEVALFTANIQQMGLPALARDVGGLVDEKIAMNANVLDHLLAYPELIPMPKENLGEDGAVLFWGTVYEDEEGEEVVRGLSLDDGEWTWSYVAMSSGIWGEHPAAVWHTGED